MMLSIMGGIHEIDDADMVYDLPKRRGNYNMITEVLL